MLQTAGSSAQLDYPQGSVSKEMLSLTLLLIWVTAQGMKTSASWPIPGATQWKEGTLPSTLLLRPVPHSPEHTACTKGICKPSCSGVELPPVLPHSCSLDVLARVTVRISLESYPDLINTLDWLNSLGFQLDIQLKRHLLGEQGNLDSRSGSVWDRHTCQGSSCPGSMKSSW